MYMAPSGVPEYFKMRFESAQEYIGNAVAKG